MLPNDTMHATTESSESNGSLSAPRKKLDHQALMMKTDDCASSRRSGFHWLRQSPTSSRLTALSYLTCR